MTQERLIKLRRVKNNRSTSTALKLAIEGLEEIEILSRHPNSDHRINDWAEITLSRIADSHS